MKRLAVVCRYMDSFLQIQYEQRLDEQEQLLACKLKEASQNQHDSSSRVKALEKELDDVKEAHQITVGNLEAEIDVLKHQNAEWELKKDDKDDRSRASVTNGLHRTLLMAPGIFQ